jgi:threonine/homoserine/homoserine lactone efflux protein
MHSNDYDLTFAKHAEGSGTLRSYRLIIGSSIAVVVFMLPHAATCALLLQQSDLAFKCALQSER